MRHTHTPGQSGDHTACRPAGHEHGHALYEQPFGVPVPEPLTPHDVETVQFTSRRLGNGYDVDEVDDFLDLVAERIADLMRETDELATTLAAERAHWDEAREGTIRAIDDLETTAITAMTPFDRANVAAVAADYLNEVNQQMGAEARQVGKRPRPFIPPTAIGWLGEGIADAVIAATRTEQVEDVPAGMAGDLTAAEHRFVALLGQAWDLLVTEIVDSDHNQPADLAELIGPMHTLQNAVLAQAASRAYPDRYRRLGTSLGADRD